MGWILTSSRCECKASWWRRGSVLWCDWWWLHGRSLLWFLRLWFLKMWTIYLLYQECTIFEWKQCSRQQISLKETGDFLLLPNRATELKLQTDVVMNTSSRRQVVPSTGEAHAHRQCSVRRRSLGWQVRFQVLAGPGRPKVWDVNPIWGKC